NKYWMCDAGRTTQYKWVNVNRVSGSYIRSDKGLVRADADTAYTAIAKAIKQYKSDEVMIVVGGMLSNEDVYTVKKLASEVIHTNRLVVVERTDTGFADSFLRTADRNANSHGIASLGITSIKPNEIADYISKNHIKALLVLGDEIIRGDEAILSAVKSLSFFALATFNECQSTEIANVIIGSATYAESEGTYTNITDRVQHFTPAIVTKENMRIMGMKMSRLDKFGAQNDRWTQGDKRDCKQHWRIAQGIAEALGTNFGYKNSESVFDDIVKHVTGYNHMSYDALDSHLGLTLNHAQHPESLGVIYESHTLKPN
ncbi:MAG: molybdopterin-dependent oxidoreductase, partial [Candidatus Kapabacteria bacterium]|nr:molybdopterin-dependent oxidoreductase [Candidatus Kapabacteria bacterium]